jgi:hypothetical protein
MISQFSAPSQLPATYTAPQYDEPAFAGMRLEMLAQRCREENERFYRGEPYDPRYGYELFRRALVEHDEAAWGQLFNHYRGLVESWVRRCGGLASSGESSEFFVTAAFMRFCGAITPERFASFPTLGALLHYLRCCVGGAVIDSVRTNPWNTMLPEEAAPAGTGQDLIAIDDEVVERISRAEFWHSVAEQLHSEAERVVICRLFVQGMKPADIYRERPDLFARVSEIYAIRRNVLKRLSRSSTLRQLAG